MLNILIKINVKHIIKRTITILHIIRHPVFYLKHDVSETGFCLRLEVVLTQLGPIYLDRRGMR
jgi:hypothetical protein